MLMSLLSPLGLPCVMGGYIHMEEDFICWTSFAAGHVLQLILIDLAEQTNLWWPLQDFRLMWELCKRFCQLGTRWGFQFFTITKCNFTFLHKTAECQICRLYAYYSLTWKISLSPLVWSVSLNRKWIKHIILPVKDGICR